MEDVLAVRDEYRLQGWAEIIRERQASGLTNKEFCAQRGITEKTYYYWLRKVREAAAETVAPQLVRLEERGEGERAHRIEIRYGEAELKLPEDVDLRAVSGCVGQGTVPCPIVGDPVNSGKWYAAACARGRERWKHRRRYCYGCCRD